MVLQIVQEGTKHLSPEHFPWALLYRGAVPWETIEAFSCRSTWSIFDQIIDDEDWCLTQRDTLSERIFAYIGSLPEEQATQRRQVIRLRRDLYNMQPSINQQEVLALQAALPDSDRLFLQYYWMRCQRLSTLRKQAQEQLQQGAAQARTQLCLTVQETPALLKGIALIAPELYDQAQHFLLPTFKRKANRLEKEEISLLLYLVRTATKTSAFSTFTSIALAHTQIGSQEHCQLIVPDETQTSVAAVNHLPIVLLTHALTRHAALRQYLSVHVNPYCIEENGQYKIIRTTHYRATMRNVAYTQAERLSLPATPLLRELLAYAQTSSHTPYSLKQWLQERMMTLDTAKVARFVDQLLELQVLHFDLEGLQTKTIVRDVIEQLQILPEHVTAHQPLVEALHSIERDEKAFSDQAPAQRVEAERRIVGSIKQCFQEVGETLDSRARVTEPALYENSVLLRRDIRLFLPNSAGLMDDFQLLANILPLFDANAVPRAILTAFFTQTYGSGGQCHDFLQFLLKLRQTFPDDVVDFMTGLAKPTQQTVVPEVLNKYAGEARAMLELRSTFLQTLVQAMYAEDKELFLDRDWLQQMADRIPATMLSHKQQHYAYMCQSVPRAEGDLLVLNTISNGWGRQIGVHAANLMEVLEGSNAPQSELHTLLCNNLAQLSLPGHEFVEIVTTQGFNGNIQPLFTKRVLVVPGEWCPLPAEQQMTLQDITLVHDPEEQRLRLLHKRDGVEVHLLYTGLLFPGFLGPLQRWLQPFTPSFMWGDGSLLSAFMGRQEQEENALLHYPRVRLGQLVLSRRKWIMPAEQWLQWDSRQLPEVQQLLDIERWRRQIGLPEQVYVRPVFSKRIKPQFVDFHHLLLMAALPKRMQNLQGKIKVEEALPAPAEYHLTQSGKHVTSTFWIELRSKKGA